MREIPECLNRRYKALDQLVKELSTAITEHDSETECTPPGAKDPSIKLMCDFWNILKEDPECNLTQAVQQRMGLNTSSGVFGPRHLTCYMAGKGNKKDEDKMRDAAAKIKNICCKSSSESSPKPKCCASKSVSPSMGSDVLPLSKVLCNLKEAASFDKKCSARVNDLMTTEKQLQDQIQHLEHREKEGVKLLKQADCMWSCMEEAYKKKVAESLERQKTLLKQLKDVEGSAAKWRKNKKDLELQMTSINKCQQEINEKMNQKKNDIKCMDVEIADFKKRIENNKKEVEASKKSLSTKKQASDAKIATIAAEIKRLEKALEEEKRHKTNKEQEGNKYVKEARDDLQKMCKVLLQKKIENEDLRAEKQALLDEIELLKQTCEQCKEKCKNKQQSIIDEIKKVEKEIANFKVKCIRCHECTDTDDVRKFCTDCPKCLQERDCIYENDHCRPDQTMDCVCMSVKQKFLDNVFDNMYTVLERQVKTAPGKAVAEAVLNCLKRSRNGKLNEETRHILQEFILSTVKKNLNLTIVGGAVKTRCEMDPETYKQLMLCLKQVKAVRPPKADKGTAAKKESCRRWGGTSECNCPKGPKACICTRKAPRPPSDPTPCPEPDKEDAGEVVMCPHKESTACGPDCAMHAVPSCVGTELAAWKPDPCQGPSCPYSKNMRAAQCVLGPESLSSVQKTTVPIVPSISAFDDEITCRCKGAPVKPCECCKGRKHQPRERIIEEVMGRYSEVSAIEKVETPSRNRAENEHNIIKECDCPDASSEYFLADDSSQNDIIQICGCSSNKKLSNDRFPSKRNANKRRIHICRSNTCGSLSFGSDASEACPNSVFDVKSNMQMSTIKINTSDLKCTKKAIGSCWTTISFKDVKCDRCTQSAIARKVKNKKDKMVVKSGSNIFGRAVCDTAKEIIKDIIVNNDNGQNNAKRQSKVEWVSLEALLKELMARSKDMISNVSLNEIETNNQLLEGTKNTDC